MIRRALGHDARRRLPRLLRRLQAPRGPGRPRAGHAVGARPLPPALLSHVRDRRTVREAPGRRGSGSARHLGAMLGQMADRGPDSAGIADLPRPGAGRRDEAVALRGRTRHEVVIADGDADARRLARGRAPSGPGAQVMSAGARIEIIKEVGDPRAVRRALRPRRDERLARPRPHADGDREQGDDRGRAPVLHRPRPVPRPQRLALEPQRACGAGCATRGSRSRPRTTPRSRPATSSGGCARATRSQAALEACLVDLDGFYTFAVGTADGFAVLRDPIACKPAVMAENDEWVAMASEYRAIAVLPGADAAEVWEPEPGQRLLVGARATVADGGRRRGRSEHASTSTGRRPLRELNRRLHAADVAPRWRVAHPTARTRSPSGSTPRSRSTSTATSATTAPA